MEVTECEGNYIKWVIWRENIYLEAVREMSRVCLAVRSLWPEWRQTLGTLQCGEEEDDDDHCGEDEEEDDDDHWEEDEDEDDGGDDDHCGEDDEEEETMLMMTN